MKNTLEMIWAFVMLVRAQVPGPVRWLTVAIEDENTFDNGDAAAYNVCIGDGTATFSVAEAKRPDEAIVKRTALQILNMQDEAEADQKLAEADQKLAQLDEQQAALQQERTRLEAMKQVIEAIQSEMG